MASSSIAADEADPAEIQPVTLSRSESSVRLYRPADRPSVVVVFGSGDGGWSYFERRCSVFLSQHQCLVVGVDFNAYAQSPFTPDQLAADWVAWSRAGRRSAGDERLPLVWGGWSMGAEQSVAAVGSGRVPSGEGPVGLLLLAPGSRGRYGLQTSDRLGLAPTGPGTFGLADFSARLGTIRVAQFHPSLDLLDDTTWLHTLQAPHQTWVLGQAVHNFAGPSEEFYRQLLEGMTWTLATGTASTPLENLYQRSIDWRLLTGMAAGASGVAVLIWRWWTRRRRRATAF